MKQKLKLGVVCLLIGIITACSASQPSSHSTNHITAYKAQVSLSEDKTKLEIELSQDGKVADFHNSSTIFHAHLVPTDVSTLYHEHPKQLESGRFILDV